jgi:hypothetical protein
MSNGCFHPKIAGHFALSFSPFRGQKTRAPNHYIQLGISDSSFEGAKLSDSRRLSTGFWASRFFRHAEDLLKFTSARQIRKRILCCFLTHKYRQFQLFQPPLG